MDSPQTVIKLMMVISEISEISSFDRVIKRSHFWNRSKGALNFVPLWKSIQIWIDLHLFPVEQIGSKLS